MAGKRKSRKLTVKERGQVTRILEDLHANGTLRISTRQLLEYLDALNAATYEKGYHAGYICGQDNPHTEKE